MRLETGAVIEIRTTFGSRHDAESCGAFLVEQRLAACVQIDGPVRSTYRWQGLVEAADEFRCVCKTTPERMQSCVETLIRRHPYQTPEILCAQVTASAGYAAWVRASVEPA